MGEAAVLYASAIEVFSFAFGECESGGALVELQRCGLAGDHCAATQVGDGHESVGLAEVKAYGRRGYGDCRWIVGHGDIAGLPARIDGEDLGRRIGLRIADYAALRIIEQAEHGGSVEIYRHAGAVGHYEFGCGGIEQRGALHTCVGLGSDDVG